MSHDFTLFTVDNGFMVGVDENRNPVVVCPASNPNQPTLMQKTKMLSVECNVKVAYMVDTVKRKNVVHIVRCFAQSRREQDIFLELSPLFIEACAQENQVDAILEVVSTLTSFFADKTEPTDRELQGIYAELYTILYFEKDLHLSRYWQSKDRMKFDFSISETFKIEVKSTVKNRRQHHFRHEQLMSTAHSIFIVSYIFRPDDEGLSLKNLIAEVKPLLSDYPSKILIIDRYLKNTSENRLDEFRFNEPLLKEQMRVYRADDVPKFGEIMPSGVSNAEYDCLLDNIPAVNLDAFIETVKENIK